MVKFWVVLGLALAACDRGSAAKSGPDCNAAAATIVSVLTEGEQSVTNAEAKGKLSKLCGDAKWSSDARGCYATVKTADAIDKCTHDHLTGAQSDNLDIALSTVSTSTAAAFAKMKQFDAELCACKDAKCAQDVSDEMTKWGAEQAKKTREPPKMTEADTDKFQELGKHMGDCMMRAMGAEPMIDGSSDKPSGEGKDENDQQHPAPAPREGDVINGQTVVH